MKQIVVISYDRNWEEGSIDIFVEHDDLVLLKKSLYKAIDQHVKNSKEYFKNYQNWYEKLSKSKDDEEIKKIHSQRPKSKVTFFEVGDQKINLDQFVGHEFIKNRSLIKPGHPRLLKIEDWIEEKMAEQKEQAEEAERRNKC